MNLMQMTLNLIHAPFQSAYKPAPANSSLPRNMPNGVPVGATLIVPVIRASNAKNALPTTPMTLSQLLHH